MKRIILGSIFESVSKKYPFVNVKAGKLTYGQRIELGVILSNGSKSEFEYFMESMECLYSRRPKARHIAKLMPQFNEVLSGLKFWIEQEQMMLRYEPSPEEKRAGISELSKKVGSMSTIKALAKAYGVDPDEILEWEYGKVFGILYTDLEESKFKARYQEELNKKVPKK